MIPCSRNDQFIVVLNHSDDCLPTYCKVLAAWNFTSLGNARKHLKIVGGIEKILSELFGRPITEVQCDVLGLLFHPL